MLRNIYVVQGVIYAQAILENVFQTLLFKFDFKIKSCIKLVLHKKEPQIMSLQNMLRQYDSYFYCHSFADLLLIYYYYCFMSHHDLRL